MQDGPSLVFDRHQEAWQRMAMFSKKSAEELWIEEARICFGGTGSMPGVAGITPPYGEGKLQNARSAEAHAKSKIAADINSLYGSPGDAFEAIQEKAPGQAQAFWYLYKHNDVPGASDILRAETGSIIHPFDDGVYHRRNFRRRSRGGRNFRFYVSDPKNLKAYVQLEQEMVWWLASGWAEPLRELGAKLPTGVTKHAGAPGDLQFKFTNGLLSIEISNDVSYAGAIADMERRIMTVMNDWRVARLDRMHENYLAKLAGSSGMKLG